MQDQDKTKEELIRELQALRSQLALQNIVDNGLSNTKQGQESQDQKYLNIVPSIIISINKEEKIVFINQMGCKILGYEQTELIGKNWFDTCIPPKIRQDMKQVYGQLMSGTIEVISYYENLVLTKTGEERLISWHNSLILRDETGTIDGTLSTGIDITERKQAEFALQQSEAKLRAILEAIPDLMFRLGRDGTHLEFYAPHLNQLFVKPENFLGKRIDEVLPTETADIFRKSIQDTLDTKQVQVFEYHLDFEKRGQFHYEARMVASGEEDVLVIVRDITERKRIELHQLDLAVQHERIQVLEQIISDLSHDIKTPISSIQMNLYLIEKQADPQKQIQYLKKIESQTQRLTKLVENILLMSRLDKGAQLLFAPVEINALIENVMRNYHLFAEQKNLSLEFKLDENLPHIRGNESELNRSLSNLIENAIRYTPDGKSISIRSYLQSTYIVIDIQDTGIGISDADLPHIFNRFYRADKARNANQGGTGLGLAIVKRIIELHAGEISVESQIEVGSTFSIKLPRTSK